MVLHVPGYTFTFMAARGLSESSNLRCGSIDSIGHSGQTEDALSALHTAVTLLVWPSYVSTAWLLPEATSNSRMWGLPAAANRRLSVVISSLLTWAAEHPCEVY